MRSLLLAEVVFVLVGLVGVALVSLPAALILAGVLGVVACERASSAPQAPAAVDRPGSNVRPLRRSEAA